MRAPNNHLGLSLQRDNLKLDTAPSPLSSPKTPNTPALPSPLDTDAFQNQTASPINTAARDPSPRSKTAKSFFSNPMASRSTTKLPKSESPSRNQQLSANPQSSMAQVYSMNRAMGSSPELTLTLPGGTDAASLAGPEERSGSNPFNPSTTPDNMGGPFQAPKKKSSKHKFNILGRKQSLKDDDPQPTDMRLGGNSKPKQYKSARDKSSVVRNRSLERQTHHDDGYAHPGSSTNGHPQNVQHNIRNAPTRAADGFGRAAKGLLGKISNRAGLGDHSDRSRNHARDEAEAQKAALTKNYKIINLPLDEQTRVTRICKRLEDCKDKTEFWLPAVAYRCIDYLNDKGMTHEGLYRVPGSEREIRNWIWRFDNEHDIDLLAEEDLYDVNTISSMFKAWLRDLPDEIFPKKLQHEIVASIGGNLAEHQSAPELLKEELSNLAPFNYYLLFAVTAHIMMLLNSSKENKMSFHNLCVCFMPALKMEMPCFSWLILDWKNCWQGCATERDYLEREYTILERRDPEYQQEGVRPVQHFDRYDRFPSPQPSQDHPRPLPNDYAQEKRPDYQRNGSNGDSRSTPASPPRPSTSPHIESSVPQSKTPSSRDQNRAVPVASPSNSSSRVRRDSEPESDRPLWTKQGSEAPNWSVAATHQTGTPGRNGAEPPELSPVKPLSPFGSLSDM